MNSPISIVVSRLLLGGLRCIVVTDVTCDVRLGSVSF